nr:protein kintoun [Leptinotarsa decemlineata]
MDNSFNKLKELDLTSEEVNCIGEALKKPEFRKLLTDYVEELQDPKNKILYEQEITQLEKERGNDITFIHPRPGYVIKTSVNGNQKAFINICANDHIKKPTSSPTIREGEKGLTWSLPHSLSPPREDLDNKKVPCRVFDIVFHSDTLHLASKNKTFRDMVNNTALEAIETNFDFQLDKKNLKFPKLNYKGIPHASVIRSPSENKPKQTPEEKEFYDKIFEKVESDKISPKKCKKVYRRNSLDEKSNYTTPNYTIKHRSHVDIQEFTENREAKLNAVIPKELIVEINLPLLKSSADITLDVTEKTVQVVSESPAKYKLNLTLPYHVNEASGNAKFDKDLRKLVITLPVRQSRTCFDFSDSGVESDQCSPGIPESDDETSDKKLVTELPSSENCVEKSSEFRTKFLDENLHYNIPEFTCHVFENIIAFTLNVKNVDENSVSKIFGENGTIVHTKFTSIGSSFYPSHYAFCVKLPSSKIDAENTTVEVWDNNVILQVPVSHCETLTEYFFGVNEDNLTEKHVEEPQIINTILLGEETEEKSNKQLETHSETPSVEPEPVNHPNSQSSFYDTKCDKKTRAIDILGDSYESSGDELCYGSFSPSKNKGILKRLSSNRFTVSRSISESSLDDFVCSSFENCHASLDSVIPEDGEISGSLKKTVRFNDVVTQQLFRSNSSILGQKKKNQRKAKNKKRALERRHSESEASGDEKKEEDFDKFHSVDKISSDSRHEESNKSDNDIFHFEGDGYSH